MCLQTISHMPSRLGNGNGLRDSQTDDIVVEGLGVAICYSRQHLTTDRIHKLRKADLLRVHKIYFLFRSD